MEGINKLILKADGLTDMSSDKRADPPNDKEIDPLEVFVCKGFLQLFLCRKRRADF